jgi:hypothetical protein
VSRDLLANRLLLKDYYLPLEGITAAACCGPRLVLLADGGRLLAADLLQQQQQQQQQQGQPQAPQADLAARLLPRPVLGSLGRVSHMASAGSRLALLAHSGLLHLRELGAAGGACGGPGSSREELQQQLALMMGRLELQAGGCGAAGAAAAVPPPGPPAACMGTPLLTRPPAAHAPAAAERQARVEAMQRVGAQLAAAAGELPLVRGAVAAGAGAGGRGAGAAGPPGGQLLCSIELQHVLQAAGPGAQLQALLGVRLRNCSEASALPAGWQLLVSAVPERAPLPAQHQLHPLALPLPPGGALQLQVLLPLAADPVTQQQPGCWVQVALTKRPRGQGQAGGRTLVLLQQALITGSEFMGKGSLQL